MLLEGQKVLVAAAVSLLRMHKSKQTMHVQSGLVSVRICTRTYVNVCTYIYVRTYLHMYVHMYVRMYVWCVCVRTYVHAYVLYGQKVWQIAEIVTFGRLYFGS